MCLSGAEHLVTVDVGGNEGLCLLCITVHQEGLQAPELRDGAQGGGDPPMLEGNLLRVNSGNYLNLLRVSQGTFSLKVHGI